jgi:hypothetical protein
MTDATKPIDDKFIAMVTAKAEISLPLGQFQPISTLWQKITILGALASL